MFHSFSRRILTPTLAVMLALSLALPASAFLWFGDDKQPELAPAGAPIPRDLSLSTYKNIAIEGFLEAIDNEGDPLTFQLTSTPARGALSFDDDGGSRFVYTPYENKTGSDTFTFVAIDPAGNTSPEGTVTIQIDKASTTVSYADMAGDPSHKAAIHLAEAGIFVGKQVDGIYYFDGDTPISRNEFLSLAMSCCELDPLDDISVTGFYDDAFIPTWAKGYISSALMAGVISGGSNELGQPVFSGDTIVTQGEATVMLNNLLNLADVAIAETDCWAEQEAANLAASDVLRGETISPVSLSTALTRSDVAVLLDGALDLVERRSSNSLFGIW